MTVRDLLTAFQVLPRDAELLAFEAGCEFSGAFGVSSEAGKLSSLVAALHHSSLRAQQVWCTTAVLRAVGRQSVCSALRAS
jgi:hypothetical protein